MALFLTTVKILEIKNGIISILQLIIDKFKIFENPKMKRKRDELSETEEAFDTSKIFVNLKRF